MINPDQASHLDRPGFRIVVAATFTAEPVQNILEFWMSELNLPASVEFAPYDQVLQQLLDPVSLLSRNRHGVNVALVRLEDWVRSRPDSAGQEDLVEYMARNAAELVVAIRGAAARSTAPLIVGLCPDSPAVRGDRDMRAVFARVEEQIAGELDEVPGLCLLKPADFDLYPVADYYDPRRDQLGHIPYTPLFFAALGTILARKVHALINPPSQGGRPGLRQHAVERGRRRGRGRRDYDPAGLDGLAALHGEAGWPGVPALPVQQERRARCARCFCPAAGHGPEA